MPTTAWMGLAGSPRWDQATTAPATALVGFAREGASPIHAVAVVA